MLDSLLLNIHLRVVGFLSSIEFVFGTVEDLLLGVVEAVVEGCVFGLGDFMVELTLVLADIDAGSFHFGDELGKLRAESVFLLVFSLLNEDVVTVDHLLLSVLVGLLELSDFGVKSHSESILECITEH